MATELEQPSQPESPARYRVKEVAALSGVTVRTLHHYDQVGLLRPAGRSTAGYRLYSDGDLLRLQQILLGRELGLSLEKIRRLLDAPDADRRGLLLEQRAALEARVRGTEKMIRSVDAALRLIDDRHRRFDMKQIFDGFDPAEYEAEAKERWGETDSYRESARRTSRYTEEDWRAIKAENAAIMDEMAALMNAGEPADSDAATGLAERHRLHIDRWYYPCAPRMHAGLADMYEADHRFAENIDRHGDGLHRFLAAAIRANAGT